MSASSSRYRPHTQQRGEDTRRRLLDAGLQLFANDGFEGTSTRALADRAGVNLPAIPYYFGSKEGLYRAVADEIMQFAIAHIAPVTDRIRHALDSGATDRAELVGLLSDLLDVVIALMLDEDAANRDYRQKFFARMEAEPDATFEAMQARMVEHLYVPCCALIGRLIGCAADDRQVRIKAMTLIGQAKIFCGTGMTALLHWDPITEEHVQAVQTVIRGHIKAIFA